MTTNGELLTPAIDVNECLKPEETEKLTRLYTGMPRSARAFHGACLRKAAPHWCPDTSEYVEEVMDSLTDEEFGTFLPNEAVHRFTVWGRG